MRAKGRVAPVVVLYLGASWVLLQVANTLEEALELPGWVDRATTIALVLGFPLVLLYGFLRKAPAQQDRPTDGTIAGPRGDKPSIAVLPFTNLSDDPEREYFADGMTEDVITGLSASRHIAVKSRSLTAVYKDQAPDVREVSQRLGVTYVVEGTVRSVGDRLRITVQLVAAESGDQLWSERFDRPAKRLFEIQDEVIAQITSAVGATLAKSESQRAARVQPDSLSAWQAVQRASFYRGATGNSEEETNRSIEELRAATCDEPEYAYAHSMLAWILLYRAVNGLSDDIRADFEEAREHRARGLSLAPDDPFNLNICGGAFSYSGEADRGEELCLQALAIDPNFADAYFNLGQIYTQQGRFEEADQAFDRVEKLAPEGPISRYYEWYRGQSLMARGDYAGAEPLIRTAIDKAPAYTTPYLRLVALLVELGRTEEAKEVAARVLEVNPRLKNRTVLALEASFDREAGKRGLALVRDY